MGIGEKFTGKFRNIIGNIEKHTESEEGVGKVVSSRAEVMLKKLSGDGFEYSKKIIDNVAVFMSAAGGAGASTICANTAFMAAQKGFRILVIDLNIMYPAQHVYFSIQQQLKTEDLVGYLLGKNELGKSIKQIDLNLLDTANLIGLMYSNNRSLMDYLNCESDGSVANFLTAIDGLRTMYDFIFIDCPPNIEHVLINQALYISDQIYLVWEEGIGSVSNTERLRRNMGITGIDAYSKMRVILNKRTKIRYTSYPFEKLNIDLVDILPYASELIECGLRSELFCQKGSSSDKAANEYYHKIGELADEVIRKGGYIGGSK